METGSEIKLLSMAASDKDNDSLAGDQDHHPPPRGNYYQTMETQAKVLGKVEKAFLKLADENDIQGITKHLKVTMTFTRNR